MSSKRQQMTKMTACASPRRVTNSNCCRVVVVPIIVFCHLLLSRTESCSGAIHSFFSSNDLRYTFGVDRIHKVPEYRLAYPRIIAKGELNLLPTKPLLQVPFDHDEHSLVLVIDFDGVDYAFPLKSVTSDLLADRLTTVFRQTADGGGRLEVSDSPAAATEDCHFHHLSNHSLIAVSSCNDDQLQATIVRDEGTFVVHPIPYHHMIRIKRSSDGAQGVHVVYKRTNDKTLSSANGDNDFCGIDNNISTQDLVEDEAGVHEDPYVIGYNLAQESDLIVELAIFCDEMLWRHFSTKYGAAAWQKLQQYALTMLSNIQIMYKQPSCIPALTYRVVRYEVFQTQPSALHGGLHQNGHAQLYLDRFCRYQRSLGVRDWDHAILLTGYDIHRGYGANSISGIARLDGMCDPWNTCTLAEGLDFTSAFIGTHELGHSVGMRHDERQLMHGPSFSQITPRTDHYDGICHMLWCGQGQYGRIITSHPALEGTFCGQSKVCQLGRCVPWSGGYTAPSVPAAPAPALQQPPVVLASSIASSTPSLVDGGWSQWSAFNCQICSCPSIAGSIGITLSQRTCNNPSPANGGEECHGHSQRAAVCLHKCVEHESIEQYISGKCSEQKRLKNDQELTGKGSQLIRFPQRACKVFCDVNSPPDSQKNYRFYGENLPDGVPCGLDRYCLNGECTDVSCDGSMLITKEITDACPEPSEKCSLPTPQPQPLINNEIHGEWGLWSTCSVINKCEGEPNESQPCNRIECPASQKSEPQWSEWTSWSLCSVSCGQGSQARYRRCMSAQNTLAFSCPGQTMELRNCEEVSCSIRPSLSTIFGEWGSWGVWSACSQSCGPGTQQRIRSCILEPCDGPNIGRKACNLEQCPKQQWAPWGEWSACSATCGGVKSRIRQCSDGNNCPGAATEQANCNEQTCPPTAATTEQQQSPKWTDWSAWSVCSATCGSGLRIRTRNCQSKNCSGESTESEACHGNPCGIVQTPEANWGSWGLWSQCSETCGSGFRRRMRKCYGNGACQGNEHEREECTITAC